MDCGEHDVKFINRTGLMAIRNAVQKDLPHACFAYGIPVEVAEKIKDMSLERLETIAANQQCLFTLRHSHKIWGNLMSSNPVIADLATILSSAEENHDKREVCSEH